MEGIFNTELAHIVHWFHANKLSLNVSKTHCILFSRKLNLPPSITVGNNKIEFVNQTKFLGVTLCKSLRWESHINVVCNKISKTTGILNKLKFKIPQKSLLSLYKSFIYPYLHYCNIIWGHSAHCHLSKILKIQKRAVRTIMHKGPRDHSFPLFQELDILTIFEITIYCKCIFMFEFMTHRLPPIFHRLFSYRTDVHAHNTRSIQCFNTPRCRSEFSRKFVTYAGPFLINQLLRHPNFSDVLTLSKLNFKKRLHKLVRTPFFINI